MDNVHFMSNKNDWTTPQWLFDLLDAEFRFRCDLFATSENALCPRFLENCFTQPWPHGTAFGNPPYQRKQHGQPSTWDFVHEAHKHVNTTSVLLLPARTDTKGWHDYCMCGEIRFIRGRVRFGGIGGALGVSPFPSAVVIIGGPNRRCLGPTINAKTKGYE